MLPQLFLFILNKNCFSRNYGLPISEIKRGSYFIYSTKKNKSTPNYGSTRHFNNQSAHKYWRIDFYRDFYHFFLLKNLQKKGQIQERDCLSKRHHLS